MPLIVLIISLLFSFESMHDFHLSKCEIEYSETEDALQISISLFIDDLELALQQQGHDSLRICTKKEAPEAEQLILSYLDKYLRFTIDNQNVQLEWVGKEVSEDLSAVWCYLQISSIEPKKNISITNEVLMELFEDQQNLVKLKYSKDKKSFFLFDKSEYSGILELSK